MMDINVYVMNPFTFMIGCAWHKDAKMIELFLGLFAFSVSYGEEMT